MSEPVEVLQCDRDAAADWYGDEAIIPEHRVSNVRLGLSDENTLVQAFARHRIAAHPGTRELREALKPFASVAERAERGEIDLRDLAWPLLGVFDADDFLRAKAALQSPSPMEDEVEREKRVCKICTATVAEFPEAMCCHCYEMPWQTAAREPK